MIDLLESIQVPQSKLEKTLIIIWLLLEKNRSRLGHPFKCYNILGVVVIWCSHGFETNWLSLWTTKLISGLVGEVIDLQAKSFIKKKIYTVFSLIENNTRRWTTYF